MCAALALLRQIRKRQVHRDLILGVIEENSARGRRRCHDWRHLLRTGECRLER